MSKKKALEGPRMVLHYMPDDGRHAYWTEDIEGDVVVKPAKPDGGEPAWTLRYRLAAGDVATRRVLYFHLMDPSSFDEVEDDLP